MSKACQKCDQFKSQTPVLYPIISSLFIEGNFSRGERGHREGNQLNFWRQEVKQEFGQAYPNQPSETGAEKSGFLCPFRLHFNGIIL